MAVRCCTAVSMALSLLVSVLPRRCASFRSTRMCSSSFASSSSSSFLQRKPEHHQSFALLSTTASTSSSSSANASSSKKSKNSTTSPTAFPSVLLRRTAQSKSFRNGNQLVFSKAVDADTSRKTRTGQLALGDVVHVAVTVDTPSHPPVGIGWGVYNSHSLYQIRILVHKLLQPTLYKSLLDLKNDTDDGNNTKNNDEDAIALIVRHHLRSARALRHGILRLPNPDTDTYRLLNGEGDHLSGLAIDIVGCHTAVVVSSAGWCERYRSVIESVILEETEGQDDDDDEKEGIPQIDRIVWKSTPTRLKQDGYDGAHNSEMEPEDDTLVLSMENGIVYQTYPGLHGQKTGVYCDQRDNRRLLQQYCQGKTVLDLCCYTGGFSLNAACQGGAVQCVGVDSSQPAVLAAQANAKRNGVEEICTFIQADIAEYLRCKDDDHSKPQFDVVILDPPKLAPSNKMLEKASRKYRALNRDAINAVSDTKGGILMTCTCSAAMTQEDGGRYFLRMVQSAALSAGKHVTLLSVHGAAACHVESPIAFPAGAYLTAAVFYVHPK